MDEKFIIKEKFLLELNLLAKDMDNYYHMLLKMSELKSKDVEMAALQSAISLHEEHLSKRLEKALRISIRLLEIKFEEKHPRIEDTDFDAFWQVLEHPLLKKECSSGTLQELNILRERIFNLKRKNFL